MPRVRQALLIGARESLTKRGYARSTARDVAAAAGVSLSAIGYHFGTTEALLQQSIIAGLEEWSAELDRLLDDSVAPTNAQADTVAWRWQRVISTFADYRGVLAASFELLVQAETTPAVRVTLATAITDARAGLAAQFLGPDSPADADQRRQVGALL